MKGRWARGGEGRRVREGTGRGRVLAHSSRKEVVKARKRRKEGMGGGKAEGVKEEGREGGWRDERIGKASDWKRGQNVKESKK